MIHDFNTGEPYGSLSDLYEYDYDDRASENEIGTGKPGTPQFLTQPQQLVRLSLSWRWCWGLRFWWWWWDLHWQLGKPGTPQLLTQPQQLVRCFLWWWWSCSQSLPALSSSRKDNCKAWLWTSFSMPKTFQTSLIKRQWITIATSWQAKWLCLQWALSWSHSLQPICYQFAKMWPNERKGITLASSML